MTQKKFSAVLRGVIVTRTSIDFWCAELIVTLKTHLYQKWHITHRAIHIYRKLVAPACEFAMWAPACDCAENHLDVLSLSYVLLTPLQAISVKAFKQLVVTGLPYWLIYRGIPEFWRILKVFGYKYFGLSIWRISGDFLKAFGSKLFGLGYCMTCIFARICYDIHMQIHQL